jgi:hypothetical protein
MQNERGETGIWLKVCLSLKAKRGLILKVLLLEIKIEKRLIIAACKFIKLN